MKKRNYHCYAAFFTALILSCAIVCHSKYSEVPDEVALKVITQATNESVENLQSALDKHGMALIGHKPDALHSIFLSCLAQETGLSKYKVLQDFLISKKYSLENRNNINIASLRFVIDSKRYFALSTMVQYLQENLRGKQTVAAWLASAAREADTELVRQFINAGASPHMEIGYTQYTRANALRIENDRRTAVTDASSREILKDLARAKNDATIDFGDKFVNFSKLSDEQINAFFKAKQENRVIIRDLTDDGYFAKTYKVRKRPIQTHFPNLPLPPLVIE